LPPEKVTTILTELDPNNPDAVLKELDKLFLNHTFRVNAHLDNIYVDGETHAAGSTGNVSVTGVKPPHYASGTNSAPGGMALVGEQGPELVNLPGGSQVIPNSALGGIGEVHIHVQNMPTPNQLVAILAKYSARNGPAALRAIS